MDLLKENIISDIDEKSSKTITLLYRLYFICCLVVVGSMLAIETYYGVFSLATFLNITMLFFIIYCIYKGDKVSVKFLFFTFSFFIISNFINSSIRGKESHAFLANIHHIMAIFYLFGLKKRWKEVIILSIQIVIANSINYFTEYKLFYNPLYNKEIQKTFSFYYCYVPVLLIFFLLFVTWRNQKVIFNLYKQKAKEYEVEVEKKNRSVFDSEEVQDLNQLAENKSPSFYIKFCSTYPHFIETLKKEEYNLNKSEKEICAYIFLDYTTKDIALYTNSSVRSIESKKYRIRKKLNLSEDLVLNSSALLGLL